MHRTDNKQKKLDQIIVVDVESTCWEGLPPPGQESEIIEIGICPIEIVSRKLLEKKSILVKPEYSKVSNFCTKLTNLTQEQVENGILFRDAISILKDKYLTKQRTWASYGDYDRNQFEKQCRSRKIDYPFGSSHINIKNLFAIIKKLPHEIGMAKALNLLNLPLLGTHHSAEDDAWNIGNILIHII